MSNTRYVAGIADVIASRTLTPRARATLQTDLRGSLRDLNRTYGDALAARFALTAGDELQWLLRDGRRLWDVIHRIRHAFGAVDWVIVCARGAITTRLLPGITAPEVDGPCFHAARTLLAAAKRQRAVLALDGMGALTSGVASYYSALYGGWTRVQRRAANEWRFLEERAHLSPVARARAATVRERLDPSANSHLRRRMAWPLVAAGDRMFRAILAEGP
jgi:hypothetical protein